MVIKFINRILLEIETFIEYEGPIGVERNMGYNLIDSYGENFDKVIVLKHHNGQNLNSYIGVDSRKFMVFLLNNRGQNVQRLI